jgi:hypothetical protein
MGSASQVDLFALFRSLKMGEQCGVNDKGNAQAYSSTGYPALMKLLEKLLEGNLTLRHLKLSARHSMALPLGLPDTRALIDKTSSLPLERRAFGALGR